MIKNKDITKKFLYIIMAVMVLGKLALASLQFITAYPATVAPIDDYLMVTLAKNITEGNWLGVYNAMTLSKHSFFAVWLAFLHIMHIPFTLGNALLWTAASWFFCHSIKPVINKNYVYLLIFTGLLFNPASTAQFTTRIYRDSIFPALCLILFSAITAIGIRYKKSIKSWIPYLIIWGLSLGAVYLTREDGIWVAPFIAVAVIVITIVLFKQKQKAVAKIISLVIVPIVLFGIVLSGYGYMNYTHYGRFIISDFSQGEFKDAYGAMMSIKQDNPVDSVAVNMEVINQLYEEVPTFALLKDVLQSDEIKNGYYDKTLGEYKGGSFYWAIRMSAQKLGYYDSPQKAKQFYEDIYNEIVLAVKEGRLKVDGKIKSTVSPKINLKYVPQTFEEAFNSAKCVWGFEQTTSECLPSIGTTDEISEIEKFVYQKGNVAYVANTDRLYFSPIRKLANSFMKFLTVVYKIVIPFMTISAICWQIKQLIDDLRKKQFSLNSMLNVIMLGYILMAVFRIFMISYVEVASFTIGTYVMYLSTVHPLVIAYSLVGFINNFNQDI